MDDGDDIGGDDDDGDDDGNVVDDVDGKSGQNHGNQLLVSMATLLMTLFVAKWM